MAEFEGMTHDAVVVAMSVILAIPAFAFPITRDSGDGARCWRSFRFSIYQFWQFRRFWQFSA